jgi:hypothetical protein
MNADRSPVRMPDARAGSRATGWRKGTLDGVECVTVPFPVPPLSAPPGQDQPGRIIFYVDETTQPAALPAKGFPFSPTPGMQFLDCDGDGQKASVDLRAQYSSTSSPCRLVPTRISIAWRGDNGQTSKFEECFILSYPGYD